ncbi:MAG: NADH-quinone oxidoreductase subunit J [Phycisphaerae bacterium]|nr:NADH-quinone oxidoreductase subunit J [Phycisphaerae bacterium]
MSSVSASLLYMVFSLGGVGLYLLLPGGERRRTGAAGAVLGLLAVLALLLVLGARGLVGGSQAFYFYLFSAIAILGASRVVTHRKPVYSAIYFVLVVISTAAMLVLLQAEFLAVALVIIYAGAIIVTYLFVIMLAQQHTETVYDTRAREPLLAVLTGFVLMAAIAGHAGESVSVPAPSAVAARSVEIGGDGSTALPPGNVAAVGAVLMTRYVVVLEIAGVLLLVSMIGAVALSRKRVPYEGAPVPTTPLGQIGREVDPF